MCLNSPWLKSHRALHEIDGIIGNALEQIIGKRQITLGDVKERLLLIIAAIRTEAAEQHVSEHTNAPDIGFQRQRLVLDDLGCDKVGCALYFADILRAFDGARKAKVAQFKSVWREK